MEQKNLNDYITPEEREHFISGLHRFLVWVGEPLPDEIEIEGETINIHKIIWSCIHEKQSSEEEKQYFLDLIHVLESKEKHNEEMLHKAKLTYEDAKKLYNESAALIRAIMDLKECEEGNIQLSIESSEEIKKKIDDAKRWMKFLKNVGKTNI